MPITKNWIVKIDDVDFVPFMLQFMAQHQYIIFISLGIFYFPSI